MEQTKMMKAARYLVMDLPSELPPINFTEIEK